MFGASCIFEAFTAGCCACFGATFLTGAFKAVCFLLATLLTIFFGTDFLTSFLNCFLTLFFGEAFFGATFLQTSLQQTSLQQISLQQVSLQQPFLQLVS